MTDRTELRRLAEAWLAEMSDANEAAFIAAASPSVVLGLLDEIDRVTAEMRSGHAQIDLMYQTISVRFIRARDSLRAALARVTQERDDAERRVAEQIAAWLDDYVPVYMLMRDFGVQNTPIKQIAEMLASQIRAMTWRTGGDQ